jgi:prepilin-type N-terminal cleavage/methylation domain-containing protein
MAGRLKLFGLPRFWVGRPIVTPAILAAMFSATRHASTVSTARFVFSSRLQRLLIQQRSHTSASGFSLLELVVVVAILGILTAVSLPALMGNTERARIVSAKAALQNAVSECAVARQEGMTQAQLSFQGDDGLVANPDRIPSLIASPDGYSFDKTKGGCHAMYLVPNETTGPGSTGSGYPVLQAKLGPRGRIVKAFQYCQSTSSVDLKQDCMSWDSQGSEYVAQDCSQVPTRGGQRAECRARNAANVGSFSSNRLDLDNPDSDWTVR